MKIQFDIKYKPQIDSGEYKVETRDGRSVRIICWDRKGSLPLVVLVPTKNGDEYSYDYTSDGSYHLGKIKSEFDLFLVTPEEELTEFEESLRQVVVSVLSGETPNGSGGTMSWAIALSDDDVRELALRLLELAKKEICKGCTVGLDQYKKGHDDARKEYEKPITFHYPTYQPPCFCEGICTKRDCIDCPNQSSGTAINTSGTTKVE